MLLLKLTHALIMAIWVMLIATAYFEFDIVGLPLIGIGVFSYAVFDVVSYLAQQWLIEKFDSKS